MLLQTHYSVVELNSQVYNIVVYANINPQGVARNVVVDNPSYFRPLVFGAVFSGGTLAGCAVWQYENMREAARLDNNIEHRSWMRQMFQQGRPSSIVSNFVLIKDRIAV